MYSICKQSKHKYNHIFLHKHMDTLTHTNTASLLTMGMCMTEKWCGMANDDSATISLHMSCAHVCNYDDTHNHCVYPPIEMYGRHCISCRLFSMQRKIRWGKKTALPVGPFAWKKCDSPLSCEFKLYSPWQAKTNVILQHVPNTSIGSWCALPSPYECTLYIHVCVKCRNFCWKKKCIRKQTIK